jgi:LacI family transcriptional regulator
MKRFSVALTVLSADRDARTGTLCEETQHVSGLHVNRFGGGPVPIVTIPVNGSHASLSCPSGRAMCAMLQTAGGSLARRRNGKPVTIREIAREAGVSIATVSRSLRTPDLVKVETRAAVLEAARRHHYVLDGLAGGLASRRSGTIGLVIPTIMNSIYAVSTQAVQETAQRAGYTTLVCISEFSPKAEQELMVKLIERRVDGLVLTGSSFPPRLLRMLEINRVPSIVTWIDTPSSKLPAIGFSNAGGVRMAVEHLAGLGHRRIGFVCGRTQVNDRAAERRRSFEETMNALGLMPDPALMLERHFDYAEGHGAMRQLLASRPRPTAVHLANDVQAIGALQACRELGVDVPGEVSVIGFDDHPMARYTFPQLTTIRVPAAEMGRRATAALLARIDQDEAMVSTSLSLDLVLRQTTAPPRER